MARVVSAVLKHNRTEVQNFEFETNGGWKTHIQAIQSLRQAVRDALLKLKLANVENTDNAGDPVECEDEEDDEDNEPANISTAKKRKTK